MRLTRCTALPGLILLLMLSACRPDAPQEPVAPDARTVFIPDSTAVFAPADTATQAAPAADLDSLQQMVARLQAAVAALQQQNDSLRTARTAGTDPAALPTERVLESGEEIKRLGLNLFWALLVLIVTFYLVKGGVWLLETLSERSATRRLFFKKLLPVIRLLLWTLAVYYILIVIFQVTGEGLLAASAAIGVAVGFAAQDVLKNIFGGIIIIFDQPFQVGDKISVGGTYGEVVSIGLRSTRIVTPDDNLVSVPNSQVVEGQVANANAGALDCQVVVDLYLPGWVDVMKAKSIAYSAAANSKYVFLEKPIAVIVKDEFKETFLTHLKVKAYVLDTRYEFAFASDVTETAKAEFLRHKLLRPMAVLRTFDALPDEAAEPKDAL